tara:strand:+ start:480 stop:1034 length:555 start_codon:yes stop_codon:yes gene_type:complete
MDALMLSLILCAVSEGGGVISRRYNLTPGVAPNIIFLALVIASITNATLAATAGAWMAPMLTPEARTMFMAAALAIAGITLLFASRKYERHGAEPERHSGTLCLATRMFVTGVAGSAPFLITATSIFFADPVMSAVGGTGGCIIGAIAGHRGGTDRTAHVLRAVLGFTGVIVAFVLAMGALRLI